MRRNNLKKKLGLEKVLLNKEKLSVKSCSLIDKFVKRQSSNKKDSNMTLKTIYNEEKEKDDNNHVFRMDTQNTETSYIGINN